jgi:hypothetical protein
MASAVVGASTAVPVLTSLEPGITRLRDSLDLD